MFNFLLQCDHTFVMFFFMHHFAHIIIINGTNLKHLCLIKWNSHNHTFVWCGAVRFFLCLRNLSATLIKSIQCHILLILLMLLLLLLHLKFMAAFKSIKCASNIHTYGNRWINSMLQPEKKKKQAKTVAKYKYAASNAITVMLKVLCSFRFILLFCLIFIQNMQHLEQRQQTSSNDCCLLFHRIGEKQNQNQNGV